MILIKKLTYLDYWEQWGKSAVDNGRIMVQNITVGCDD